MLLNVFLFCLVTICLLTVMFCGKDNFLSHNVPDCFELVAGFMFFSLLVCQFVVLVYDM